MSTKRNWGGAARIPATSDNGVAWVIAKRLEPDGRLLELLHDEPRHPAYKDHQLRLTHPFSVVVVELDRESHESDRYEGPDDYIRHEIHRFESEAEAEAFISSFGVDPEDLVVPYFVDAP